MYRLGVVLGCLDRNRVRDWKYYKVLCSLVLFGKLEFSKIIEKNQKIPIIDLFYWFNYFVHKTGTL